MSKPNMVKRLFHWVIGEDKKQQYEAIQQSPNLTDEQRQLSFGQLAMNDLLAERKSERRWRAARRIGIALSVALVVMTTISSYIKKNGEMPNFAGNVIGVVHIDGEIGPGAQASVENVIPALKRAFDGRAKAVILSIDSGGGVPNVSEQIITELDILRKEHPKPVYAVINTIGASAAYMIAIHADKIYAGNYSLVGSIGAILATWNVSPWPERLDLTQLVFKSGANKDILNPYREMTTEEKSKMQSLVMKMAGGFIEDVKKRRGKKLATDVNLFTGEAWTGGDALKYGLIDQIGTVTSVVNDLKGSPIDLGPHPEKSPFSSLLGEMSDAVVEGVVHGVHTLMTQAPVTPVRM